MLYLPFSSVPPSASLSVSSFPFFCSSEEHGLRGLGWVLVLEELGRKLMVCAHLTSKVVDRLVSSKMLTLAMV